MSTVKTHESEKPRRGLGGGFKEATTPVRYQLIHRSDRYAVGSWSATPKMLVAIEKIARVENVKRSVIFRRLLAEALAARGWDTTDME